MGRFIKKIWQLPQVALKQFASDILRLAFLLNRPRRLAQKGFVLPTTVLLTIMVALTVTALTYRTFIRSEQAIGQREQQVIVNAATPAIDRAKAKIEFLFRKDNRLPAGLPSSDVLYDLMSTRLGTGNFVGYTGRVSPIDRNNPVYDPYTLPGETRVDINGDGDLDNAWSFSSEGKTLVYSILVDDAVSTTDSDALPRDYVTQDLDLKAPASALKANSLITRTGPVATTEATPQCRGAVAEQGWQVVAQGNNSQLQKNFQINAFVANDSDVNQTFETLEFQQSRQAARGNKWGAWFRYDLELFPGPRFHWNGAMHTDSNLIIHRPTEDLHLHMVSSPNSCIYNKESSEITLSEQDLDGADGINPQSNSVPAGSFRDFQGQVINGFTKDNRFKTDSPFVHIFNGRNNPPVTTRGLNSGPAENKDSVNPNSDEGTLDVAVNPLTLFTEDETQHINTSSWRRDPDWDRVGAFKAGDRMFNDEAVRPYVDDFYRADDRWGPKPKYDSTNVYAVPPGNTIGDDIGNVAKLTDPSEGLDGYWERQSMQKGLRLIVGQRLELGNANGWDVPPPSIPKTGDPLYPANNRKSSFASGNTAIGGDHEYLQRKALRDNLTAVQGMVVYHYERNNGEFPAACVALTAHPGTRQTIVDSRSFDNWLSGGVKTDFLNGKGTNGWEFEFFDSSAFASLSGSNLGDALRNLANFAGDPQGGAPSFKPVQDQGADAVVHPFPYMAMWGDFSVLRRILDSNKAYADLSPADQVTLHSAACTLGMLAYNLKSAEDELAYLNAGGSASLQSLAAKLSAAATTNPTLVGRPLKEWLAALPTPPGPPTAAEQAAIESLARWGQINRDRQFGFLTPANSTPPAPPTTPTCNATDFTGVTNAADRDNLAYAFCSVSEPPKYPSLFYLFPSALHDQIGTPVAPQPATEDYIRESSGTGYMARTVVNGSVTYTPVNPGDIALQPRNLAGSDWVLPVATTTGRIDDPSPDSLDNTTANSNGNAFKINAGTNGVLQVAFLDKGIYNGREQLNTRVLDIDLEALTTQTVVTDYWLSANLDRRAEGIVYAFREDAVREDEIVRPKGTVNAAYCSQTTGSNPREFRIETDANCRMRVLPGSGGAVQDPPLTDDKRISLKPVDFIPDPERRPHGFRLRTASGNPTDFSGTNYARKVGMTLVTDNSVYIMGNFNLHSTNGLQSGIIEEFRDTPLLKDVALGPGYIDAFYNRATLNTDNFANLARDHWRPVEILSDAISVLSGTFRDGAIEDGFRSPTPTTAGGNTDTTSYMNQNRPIFRADVFPNGLDPAGVIRENGGNTSSSPVYIDRNGTYYVTHTKTSIAAGSSPVAFHTIYDVAQTGNNQCRPGAATDVNCWLWFTNSLINRDNNIRTADTTPTFVNAVFVSGIVPSRIRQPYGGLHNYPRLIEYWKSGPNSTDPDIDLHIAGAFLQLNFSTAATAPHEQIAWEEGQLPRTATGYGNTTGYYKPPNRRWGYDVGLLYVPPAPAARRFVTFGAPRSEYYRELPADDPYVVNLRCARNANGALVFPNNNVCPS